MPLRNERVYEVINKDYFPKDFKVSLIGTGMATPDSCCFHLCFFPLCSLTRLNLVVVVGASFELSLQTSFLMCSSAHYTVHLT